MATQTLKANYKAADDVFSRTPTILRHSKSAKEIYYQLEDELDALNAENTATGSSPSISAAPVAQAAPVTTAPSGPVALIEDAPVPVTDILSVIVPQKLKKKLRNSKATGGRGGGATINIEEFPKFQADHEPNVELYMHYLARDSRGGEIAYEKASSTVLQAKLDTILREHVNSYIDDIQPQV